MGERRAKWAACSVVFTDTHFDEEEKIMRTIMTMAVLGWMAMNASADDLESGSYYGSPTLVAAPRVVTTLLPVSRCCQCSPCQSYYYSNYRPTTVYYPSNTAVAPASVTVFRPVVAIMPMPSTVYMGRGILGQPTAYVAGQPVRNTLRWLSP